MTDADRKNLLKISYRVVDEVLDDLLNDEEGETTVLLLSGALHAVFEKIETTYGSGLHSTEFIVATLQNCLENQIRLLEPNDDDVIH
tara:strand:+ start:5233 stop:5493 length:261 start_codon:yes stop_codon:yes gene_type:complete